MIGIMRKNFRLVVPVRQQQEQIPLTEKEMDALRVLLVEMGNNLRRSVGPSVTHTAVSDAADMTLEWLDRLP